jgi:hypothetical protein
MNAQPRVLARAQWSSRVFNPDAGADHAEGAGDVSPRKQRVRTGRRGVREARPAVPLGLGGWDRFTNPLNCGNSSLEGLGQGCEGVPAVLNPRAQRRIERHRNGTGRDTMIRMVQGCFVGYQCRCVGWGWRWTGTASSSPFRDRRVLRAGFRCRTGRGTGGPWPAAQRRRHLV